MANAEPERDIVNGVEIVRGKDVTIEFDAQRCIHARFCVTGAPRVFLYNLETNRREVLGDFPGMTFAPRFSPDGQRVLVMRVHRPYSYLHPVTSFPHTIEVWDRTGAVAHTRPGVEGVGLDHDEHGDAARPVLDLVGGGEDRVGLLHGLQPARRERPRVLRRRGTPAR